MKFIDKEKDFEIDNIYTFVVQDVNNNYKIQSSKIYYYSQEGIDLDVSNKIYLNKKINYEDAEFNILSIGKKDPRGMKIKGIDKNLNEIRDILSLMHKSSVEIAKESNNLNERNYLIMSNNTVNERNSLLYSYLYDKYKTEYNPAFDIYKENEINLLTALELIDEYDIDIKDRQEIKKFYKNMFLPIAFEEKNIDPKTNYISEQDFDCDENIYRYNIKREELEFLNNYKNKKNSKIKPK